MAIWKELITTDNISDYVGGGEAATHDHIISLNNATIRGTWCPVIRCPYITPFTAFPEILTNQLQADSLHQVHGLSSEGLQIVHYTKDPDAQVTYDDENDVGNGNIWSPGITTAINDVAIGSPFSGGQNWKIKTAEISIGQSNQSGGFLANKQLKLLWGKFDATQAITDIPGILLDHLSGISTYNDEPAYNKITLPNVGSNQYAITEWSTLGTSVWDFPSNTFNEGITNISCPPPDTFTLTADEKLIPFVYIMQESYSGSTYDLINGVYDFNLTFNANMNIVKLNKVNITLNFTTETVL
tara:strand:- start:1382 stop:2278 length:897 start_codon:yes stop_codon:yes gene_type:complete